MIECLKIQYISCTSMRKYLERLSLRRIELQLHHGVFFVLNNYVIGRFWLRYTRITLCFGEPFVFGGRGVEFYL